MLSVFTIVRGADETINVQLKKLDDQQPFPLTGLVSANARFKKEDGTVLSKGMDVVNSAEGRLSVSLTAAETAVLEVKDGTSFEIELNYTNGSAKASLVRGDLTFTAKAAGVGGNGITVALVTGGTAGSESVGVVGQAITVTIEGAVSTATQIKAALDASGPACVLITTAISGTGSATQALAAAANLAGGTPTTTEMKLVPMKNILKVEKRLFT